MRGKQLIWRDLWKSHTNGERVSAIIRAGLITEVAEEYLDDPNALPKAIRKKLAKPHGFG